MKNLILLFVLLAVFLYSGCSHYKNIYPARSNQAQWDQDRSYCSAVAIGNAPMPNMQNSARAYAPSSGTMEDQYGNVYRYQETYNAMSAAQSHMDMAQQNFANAGNQFRAIAAEGAIRDICLAQLGWREVSD